MLNEALTEETPPDLRLRAEAGELWESDLQYIRKCRHAHEKTMPSSKLSATQAWLDETSQHILDNRRDGSRERRAKIIEGYDTLVTDMVERRRTVRNQAVIAKERSDTARHRLEEMERDTSAIDRVRRGFVFTLIVVVTGVVIPLGFLPCRSDRSIRSSWQYWVLAAFIVGLVLLAVYLASLIAELRRPARQEGSKASVSDTR